MASVGLRACLLVAAHFDATEAGEDLPFVEVRESAGTSPLGVSGGCEYLPSLRGRASWS